MLSQYQVWMFFRSLLLCEKLNSLTFKAGVFWSPYLPDDFIVALLIRKNPKKTTVSKPFVFIAAVFLLQYFSLDKSSCNFLRIKSSAGYLFSLCRVIDFKCSSAYPLSSSLSLHCPQALLLLPNAVFSSAALWKNLHLPTAGERLMSVLRSDLRNSLDC